MVSYKKNRPLRKAPQDVQHVGVFTQATITFSLVSLRGEETWFTTVSGYPASASRVHF